MTLEAKIAVMQAAMAGKTIEFREIRPVKPKDGWMLCEDPFWNWVDFEYRVQPEPPKPLECWANVYESGLYYHSTEATARSWANVNSPAPLRVAVHLKEVQ